MSGNIPLADHVQRAALRFHRHFGRKPRFAAAAPGRVNLIGEHTDYNDGFVLPVALERRTVIVADARADNQVQVVSTSAEDPAHFVIDGRLSPGSPSWANYVKGVIAGYWHAGMDPGGFDALIDSTVPVGGGVSSSAALEVAAATLIEQMADRRLDPVAKALLCQQAEHEFAGMPCGIMDQFIAVLAEADHAMLLDCRSRQVRMVRLNDPQVTVLVINSNVKHELVGGEYAQRRAQCEQAARMLGVAKLREVSLETLAAGENRMDATVYRRARHVVGENVRTVRAAEALAAGHWAEAGRLMFESHQSLRDDFQVSCPELDLLVDLARHRCGHGLWGARMTGGGFGGCTVNLVATDHLDALRQHVCGQYASQTGIQPTAFATRPAAGATMIRLP